MATNPFEKGKLMISSDLKSLESRRRALRMSRIALADRAGLSVPTLDRILSGEGNPTLETLASLAAALGVEFRITNQVVEPSETCSANEFRTYVARQKAIQLVKLVQGTSALEAQAVGEAAEAEMVEQTIHDLLAGSSRRLWAL